MKPTATNARARLRRAVRPLGVDAAESTPEVVSGRARLDRSTAELVRRLHHGDVAIIDHPDIDRATAMALAQRRVAAVVNAAPSITGHYPHDGPVALLRRGIPLLDQVGDEIFDAVDDGQQLAIVGSHVLAGDRRIAAGRRQTIETLDRSRLAAQEVLDDRLGVFARGALEYLRDHHDPLVRELETPDLDVDLDGRQVLVVAAGDDSYDDLVLVRRSGYLQERRPFVIGVGHNGAALLRGQGLGADLLVGAFAGTEPDGFAGVACLDVADVGFDGDAADLALLFAYERGAEVIVAVGAQPTIGDLVDRDEAAVATSLVTRLRIAPVLVDARGLSRLYEPHVRKRDLLLMVAAALFTLIVIIRVSEPLRLVLRGFRLTFE